MNRGIIKKRKPLFSTQYPYPPHSSHWRQVKTQHSSTQTTSIKGGCLSPLREINTMLPRSLILLAILAYYRAAALNYYDGYMLNTTTAVIHSALVLDSGGCIYLCQRLQNLTSNAFVLKKSTVSVV